MLFAIIQLLNYIAFAGSSGYGKSTVFTLILGDYSPQKGSLIVGDHELGEWNLHSLRNQMAVVIQEPFLLNTSLKENIKLGNLDAPDQLMEKVLSQAQILNFLNHLSKGLETQGGGIGVKIFRWAAPENLCGTCLNETNTVNPDG